MSKASVKVGDVFVSNTSGSCVVVDYCNSREITVRFIETGHEVVCRYNNLVLGRVKDPYFASIFGVGFIGQGTYLSTSSGVVTKSYSAWSSMLRRCYNEDYWSKYPTYAGCSVSEEWHNFQNFAEWYEKQPNANKDGFSLDKDIIKSSNKVYCQDYCDIVPSKVNNLLINCKATRGQFPVGVCYYSRSKKYKAQVSTVDKRIFLGYYNTPEEAFVVYKEAKEAEIKRVAEEYKDVLRPETFHALMNWQIDIDD
jgi:hypothetical protein